MEAKRSPGLVGVACAAALLLTGSTAEAPVLVPFEDPPNARSLFDVNDMTPDGGIAVGNHSYSPRPERWIEGVLEPLAHNIWARANAITPDGRVIVGEIDSDNYPEALVWRDDEMEILPRPDLIPFSYFAAAKDVSADGRTIVGKATLEAEGGAPFSAVAWVDGEMQRLADPAGTVTASEAQFISDDARVIVGRAFFDTGDIHAVRWEDGLPQILLGLTAEDRFDPVAMTPDGRVVVGNAVDFTEYTAVRWEGGELETLGFLPGGRPYSYARTVSGDGGIVMGTSIIDPPRACSYCREEYEDFVWSRETGMIPLEEWLVYGCGYDFLNWHINVRELSDDGTRMVMSSLATLLHQSFLIEIDHCRFDYEVPEWSVGPGDYYLADYHRSMLYRMRGETGELRRIPFMGHLNQATDLVIGPEGEIYVFQGNSDRIVRVNPESGEQLEVTQGGWIDRTGQLEIGVDGSLYVIRPPGFYDPPPVVVRVDPETREQSVLSEGGWLQSPAIARDADGNLLTISRVDDQWYVVRIDIETGDQAPLPIDADPAQALGQIAYDPGSNRLRVRGPNDAILVIDLDTGATTSFAESRLAGADLEAASGGDSLATSGRAVYRVDSETGDPMVLQEGGHFESLSAIQEVRARCADGLDNDRDGLADGDDPGCLSPDRDSELHRDDVAIDILPRRSDNVIREGRWLPLPLAVLGSESLDVRDVQPDDLAFGPGGAGPLRNLGRRRDVDRDGWEDLLLYFDVEDSGLEPGLLEACLSGEIEGVAFRACDALRVDPRDGCGGPHMAWIALPCWVVARRRRLHRDLPG